MKPKISVILSTYNDEKTIKESVESILTQTYKNFELIVINDASNDKTSQILKSVKDKKVKTISNKKKQGLTKCLNQGLKKAQGKFIARMDADDIALPQRLKAQLEYFEKNSKIVLCGTWAQLINKQGRKIKVKKLPISPAKIKRKVIKFNPFIHSTIMFKKSILKKIGLYNENYKFAQDYEFLLRVVSKMPAANIPQTLLKYRLPSPESVSVKNLKDQEKYALRARITALKKLDYPKWQIIFLLKPLLSYLLPANLKLFIYKKFFWRSEK